MAKGRVLEQNSGSFGLQFKQMEVEAVTADKALAPADVITAPVGPTVPAANVVAKISGITNKE